MFNGSLKIYKDYQIVPETILSESATNAIWFYFKDFSENLPDFWAHDEIFLDLQTNKDLQLNRKEILNKPGGKS